MNTVKFASIGLSHPLNAQFKPLAEKVMKELDKMKGKDFDITDIETKAVGHIYDHESSRIAKIIMDCHERGSEWVEKWNARQLSRSPKEITERTEQARAAVIGEIIGTGLVTMIENAVEEKVKNATVMAGAVGASSKVN